MNKSINSGNMEIFAVVIFKKNMIGEETVNSKIYCKYFRKCIKTQHSIFCQF